MSQIPALPPEATERIGRLVANRYRLDAILGAGGMGVVYRAWDTNLDRNVVLKVLASGVATAEAEERFKREARGMSRLEHANVVKVHESGIDKGLHFIVMEYVEGRTLAWYLRRVGPLNLATFARIASQMCAGVADAHRMGMIHRDIKPANVMLTRRADAPLVVKILDFGLAKLRDDDHQLTRMNAAIGSAAYMAPEQVKGLPVDPRADVYAMGVTFFRMLTGKRAFDGTDDMQILFQHVHGDIPSVAENLPPGHDIPPAVMALVERCMAKNPEDRPAHAGKLLDELKAAMPNSGVFRAPLAQIADLTPDGDPMKAAEAIIDRTEPGVTRKTMAPQDRVQGPTGADNTMIAIIGGIALLAVLLIGALGLTATYLGTKSGAANPSPARAAAKINPKTPEGQAEALRQQASGAMEKGDYQTAIAALEKALEIHPASKEKTDALLLSARSMKLKAGVGGK